MPAVRVEDAGRASLNGCDMKRNLLLIPAFILSVWACRSGKREAVQLNLIPRPVSVVLSEGSFCIDEHTVVRAEGFPDGNPAVGMVSGAVGETVGCGLQSSGEGGNGCIRMVLDTSLHELPQEGYRLTVDSHSAEIAARTEAGAFYGVQTFLQLLNDSRFRNGKKGCLTLPAMQITDYPAFPYRGLHLDVSRHFFPKEFVLRILDYMSLYKLNRLHWHLTDAAGWRVEIKRYPELTLRAAWRTQENYMDWWNGSRLYSHRDSAGAYGGFYTQEEIREVVAYAAERHITVIPEIEMPGHSEEVVSVFPELSCSGEPYRNGEFCIGNEKSFEFLENVLEEILELFPSEYIHIGGDEASVESWRNCPKCQAVIRRERLKNEKELQSYLIRRIAEFLNRRGRKIIGWDEIIDGGAVPGATVMSWRGERGGIAAARMGNDVIMTPGGYCYFDSYQADPRTEPPAMGGYLPYLKVYSYHPVPDVLTPEESRHIIGAQGNVWGEYISTESHAEYMIFPRMLALAEVVWSPEEVRDADDFKRRIAGHIEWLKGRGVNVFIPGGRPELLAEVDTVGKRLKISFDSELYRPEIRYSVNGGGEMEYTKPFYVTDSARIRAYAVKSDGSAGEMLEARVDYHRAIGKKVGYKYRFNDSYPAAGEVTLTDGVRGGLTYGDGRWQGFLSDVEVVIDMGEIVGLSYVSGRFMQLTGPGVYMPHYVSVSVSDDGKTFSEVARADNDVPSDRKELVIKDFTACFKARGRYVKFFARRQAGFLFLDEIVVY